MIPVLAHRTINFLTVARYFCLLSMFVIFTTCSESDFNIDYSLTTEPSLKIYFDRFEAEALNYGLDIDLESKHVYGVFGDLDSLAIGNCRYDKNQPRKVTIDREYWQGIPDLEREYIVFHELGHCFLERKHDDRQSPDGRCLSMMQSGEGHCIMRYNKLTRDDYLKELFK